MAEARVLLGDAPPHVPAAAGLDFRSPCGRLEFCEPIGGVLHAAAVGDEHQIVLAQVDASRGAIRFVVRSMRVAIFLVGELYGLRYEHAGCRPASSKSCPDRCRCAARTGPMPPPIAKSTFSTFAL